MPKQKVLSHKIKSLWDNTSDRRWRDKVYIYEALKTGNTYNPDGVADGGAYTGLTEPPKFDVTTDLLGIVEGLRSKNVPTFSDGNYRCIASPR